MQLQNGSERFIIVDLLLWSCSHHILSLFLTSGQTGQRKDQRWISLSKVVSKPCRFSLLVKSNSCPKPWASMHVLGILVTACSIQESDACTVNICCRVSALPFWLHFWSNSCAFPRCFSSSSVTLVGGNNLQSCNQLLCCGTSAVGRAYF